MGNIINNSTFYIPDTKAVVSDNQINVPSDYLIPCPHYGIIPPEEYH
jgi:hypothetical protein